MAPNECAYALAHHRERRIPSILQVLYLPQDRQRFEMALNEVTLGARESLHGLIRSDRGFACDLTDRRDLPHGVSRPQSRWGPCRINTGGRRSRLQLEAWLDDGDVTRLPAWSPEAEG